ncbi:bile acid:sodium symporter family protein [Marihabitans asiaticum]|uniref:bile acid:sodium symporter family protein n=1 Tax=Marihabitans asiaticum TaxID=415218 RepID=UPI001FEB29DC|nr:hypothetical protein [Marihabitans asiaticum]
MARRPRAVVVALLCQVVLLPLVAFGLASVFALPPLLAVGFMLLAASPGGTTANLYSHLFRGDVALNITLTAINSVLATSPCPSSPTSPSRTSRPTTTRSACRSARCSRSSPSCWSRWGSAC